MTDTVSKLAKNRENIKFIVFNGIVAALYVVFTAPFANIAYGPIQVRIAEVMTVFPIFSGGMILGVTLGCFIANLINPGNLGPVDIIGGSLATLIAGILSYIIGKKNKWLGLIPPIVVNGIIVGGYLPFLLVDPGSTVTFEAVIISMLSVAGSEAVLLLVLGIPLILAIEKTGLKNRLP
ncbi:MAG: QueT transporter family protein [Clostridiales bacterium]|nr:QueT transporter family protein [Clostridiales bacterium]